MVVFLLAVNLAAILSLQTTYKIGTSFLFVAESGELCNRDTCHWCYGDVQMCFIWSNDLERPNFFNEIYCKRSTSKADQCLGTGTVSVYLICTSCMFLLKRQKYKGIIGQGQTNTSHYTMYIYVVHCTAWYLVVLEWFGMVWSSQVTFSVLLYWQVFLWCLPLSICMKSMRMPLMIL